MNKQKKSWLIIAVWRGFCSGSLLSFHSKRCQFIMMAITSLKASFLGNILISFGCAVNPLEKFLEQHIDIFWLCCYATWTTYWYLYVWQLRHLKSSCNHLNVFETTYWTYPIKMGLLAQQLRHLAGCDSLKFRIQDQRLDRPRRRPTISGRNIQGYVTIFLHAITWAMLT